MAKHHPAKFDNQSGIAETLCEIDSCPPSPDFICPNQHFDHELPTEYDPSVENDETDLPVDNYAPYPSVENDLTNPPFENDPIDPPVDADTNDYTGYDPELAKLKSEMSVYVTKLLAENNKEILKEHLNSLKKFKFSDYVIKDQSKKRKLDKQESFLCPKKKKNFELETTIFKCLISETEKDCTDDLINAYLKIISTNFSNDVFRVEFKKTTEGQSLAKELMQEQPSYETQADISFIPFFNKDTWSVAISNKSKLSIFDKEVLKYEFNWQSGYSILLRCSQELTKNYNPHSNKMIDNFRNFVRLITMESVNVLDFCYACYKKNAPIHCSMCRLSFCKVCLKTPFICKRCR